VGCLTVTEDRRQQSTIKPHTHTHHLIVGLLLLVQQQSQQQEANNNNQPHFLLSFFVICTHILLRVVTASTHHQNISVVIMSNFQKPLEIRAIGFCGAGNSNILSSSS